MLIRWGWCAGCALVALLLARPAHAQLASLETAGLRLVYFTATESYLVPHAARTFLNSLAFQRRIFGLDPKKPVTVLMVDFSDAGNASATVVPRNNLLVDIAPLSYAFETIATNERHEHDHEPRAGAHRDDGSGGEVGSHVPASVRRQGDAGHRAARVDPLLLPDHAARRRAALVPRRHRRLHRHLDGRRPRPRAERLRRDGVPLDGPRRRALLRPARPRLGRHARSTSSSRSTRTSTARGS